MTSNGGGGFTLVLGGGGSVGIAYHCGVLRALEEVGGLDPRRADVVIGTSAGAVVGTELRHGRDYDSILEHAGVRADPSRTDGHEELRRLTPAWTSRTDLARRLVGTSWVLGRSMFPAVPAVPAPPRAIEWIFPASLFAVPTSEWAAQRFPAGWPPGRLWVVAFDPDIRRRVVLSADADDWRACALSDAVLASCTAPGILPPVRLGRRRLIDGGVRSSVNLDLAAETGGRVVIAIAPLAFDPGQPAARMLKIPRARFNRQLTKEARDVTRAGAQLLILRPSGSELRHHGLNLLRRHGNEAVYEAAYESTARRLASDDALAVLEAARA